jgi:inositol 1,4,5-triphosphate receptor type 1/inositol 1,4,5-triphosphate receptor type 3
MDDLQSWNYFIAYINLLSDICINRNKHTKQFVDQNFPLETLCSVIEDDENRELNIIEPFLKLIHHAYIDCHHYPSLRGINRVHEWKQAN